MVSRLARLVVVSAGLALALSACSSSTTRRDRDAGPGDAGPIGPDPLPGDVLCAEFADEFCRANEACCARTTEVYASFSECAREQRLLCQDRAVGFEYPEEVMAENILYNQGRVGAALDRVTTAVDACRAVDFETEILNGYTGTVGEGGTCSRLSCRRPLACIGGTCQPQPEAGTACATAAECGAMTCRADGTCQPLGAAGGGCDRDDDCATRLCVGGSCEAFTADNAYCVRLPATRPFRR